MKEFVKNKKLKYFASSTVKEATNLNSFCLCLSCKNDESKAVELQKCTKCGLHYVCTLKCKKVDSKNHETFCKSILALESFERNKTFRSFNCSFDSPLLLVRLVVNGPLIKHQLSNKNVESLWDYREHDNLSDLGLVT